MKLLYITDNLAYWGGIERVLSDKMNYLIEDGYDIYIVTSGQGLHPIPFPLDMRIHVYDLGVCFHQQYQYHGLKRLLKFFEFRSLYRNRLNAYIKDVSPDVILCIRDHIVRSVVGLKKNIPVIYESHSLCRDIDFENTTLLHRITSFLDRRYFRNLDMIVTLTEGDAEDWKRYCKNTCVIPNIVHLNSTGVYSDCQSKEVIFAGRFETQKNIGALLDVWELVQKVHPDWTLNVYGNGELKPYYEKEVRNRKLNIHINPAVSDIFEKYKESSMLIMTSMYEPFGLVLVEAMSCGLPVIAFDCPYGPADIITDGVDGFIIENGNTDAFADAVCTLIKNPELRKKMGKSGIVSSNRYKAETIMPQWIQLFTNLKRDM
jgi:glycosyltransferase involved in cell wall biosynthesis